MTYSPLGSPDLAHSMPLSPGGFEGSFRSPAELHRLYVLVDLALISLCLAKGRGIKDHPDATALNARRILSRCHPVGGPFPVDNDNFCLPEC